MAPCAWRRWGRRCRPPDGTRPTAGGMHTAYAGWMLSSVHGAESCPEAGLRAAGAGVVLRPVSRDAAGPLARRRARVRTEGRARVHPGRVGAARATLGPRASRGARSRAPRWCCGRSPRWCCGRSPHPWWYTPPGSRAACATISPRGLLLDIRGRALMRPPTAPRLGRRPGQAARSARRARPRAWIRLSSHSRPHAYPPCPRKNAPRHIQRANRHRPRIAASGGISGGVARRGCPAAQVSRGGGAPRPRCRAAEVPRGGGAPRRRCPATRCASTRTTRGASARGRRRRVGGHSRRPAAPGPADRANADAGRGGRAPAGRPRDRRVAPRGTAMAAPVSR